MNDSRKTDPKDSPPEPEDTVEVSAEAAQVEEAAAPDASPDERETSTEERETETPASEVDKLKAELAETKDRALRAVAEAENVRRRADKERADTLKYGASSLAKELLPVVDNLRRAVDAVPEDQRETNETLKNLLVGVEMTEKMLLDAFAKNQIQKIDPLDEKFNYSEHQAMSEAPGTGKPPGTVVQVLQPGYKLHDRLLRPAMVIVAKGDPAPPPDDAEAVDTTA